VFTDKDNKDHSPCLPTKIILSVYRQR